MLSARKQCKRNGMLVKPCVSPKVARIHETLWRSVVPDLGHGLLCVQRRPETSGQFARRPLSPEVSEVIGWLLTDHVVVQGNDVDARLAERPEHGLNFRSRHDEITINDGVLGPPRERRPGGQPHRPADLDSVHRPLAADRHLYDAVLSLRLEAQGLLDHPLVDIIRLRADLLESDGWRGTRGPD